MFSAGLGTFFFRLSIFVKTKENGTSCWKSHSAHPRSMFWVGTLASMSSSTFMRLCLQESNEHSQRLSFSLSLAKRAIHRLADRSQGHKCPDTHMEERNTFQECMSHVCTHNILKGNSYKEKSHRFLKNSWVKEPHSSRLAFDLLAYLNITRQS